MAGRRMQVPAKGQAPAPAPAAGPAQQGAPAPAAKMAPKAKPMPKPRPRKKMPSAPLRNPVPGTPKPQGLDDTDQTRAAKDAAAAKITKNFGIPPDLLNEFTMEELQVMPRLLQKMQKANIMPGGDKAAERAGFGGGPSMQQVNDNTMGLRPPMG